MTDFRLPDKPAWPDDMTYCNSRDCTVDCWRHVSRIDWELPRHKYYGASISEFGPVCASYNNEGANDTLSERGEDNA